MRKTLALVAILCLPTGCDRSQAPREVDAGRLGRIEVFAPQGEGVAFVYLFSGADGWAPDLERAARALAKEGAAVVGVDLERYLAGLAAATEDECHYTVAELEDWSHRLQRELGFSRYRSPILAGVGAGGTLAHAALAQSPAATLAGAVGVDPAPALATRVPLCPGAPSVATPEGFAYAAAAELPGWWREAAPDASATPGERLVGALELAELETPAPGDARLADLPLVEMPAASPSPRFAVIYSGDGGWRDLDKEIGEYLAARGTPVVGVDSLRYFWREKPPDQVAADLTRILRSYRQRWHARDALLIGYSFGAGILPFAVNRLPTEERAAVVQISLLGLEPRAPFEIAVTGWLGGLSENAPPVLPELERLELSRVQCFYGEDEEETLCRDPALARAEVIHTEGGHHFDGDYDALAQRILRGAERRAR